MSIIYRTVWLVNTKGHWNTLFCICTLIFTLGQYIKKKSPILYTYQLENFNVRCVVCYYLIIQGVLILLLNDYELLNPALILLLQNRAQCVSRIERYLLGEALRPKRDVAIRHSRFACTVRAK